MTSQLLVKNKERHTRLAASSLVERGHVVDRPRGDQGGPQVGVRPRRGEGEECVSD